MEKASAENAVKSKSYAFAVRIVKLYKHLQEKHREIVLSRQILRCGTSIGANIAEAIGGISNADFSSKISIAYKESLETKYWLSLLKDTDYLEEKLFQSLYDDADELSKMLFSILKTTKRIKQ